MKKLAPLFFNTLQKEYRNKTLLFMFIFTLLIIFAINGTLDFIQNNFEGPNHIKIPAHNKLTALYAVISLWNFILSAILGVNCVRSDNKIFSQLLSFPISRFEYLSCRILGAWVIIVGYYLISLLMGAIVFSLFSQNFAFQLDVFYSLFFTSLNILVVIILAVIYSLFFPKLLAFMATLFSGTIITLANNSLVNQSWSELFSQLGIVKVVGLFIHFLLPRIGAIGQISLDLAKGNGVGGSYLWVELAHYICTMALMGFAMNFLFKRRDL